jgi:hypothetical protein
VLLVGSVWKPRLTPGTRAARLPNWRPFRGRFSIWVPVTTSPTPEDFVSMRDDSAVTVSASVMVATLRRNSEVVVDCTLTTLFRDCVANPVRSTLTS